MTIRKSDWPPIRGSLFSLLLVVPMLLVAIRDIESLKEQLKGVPVPPSASPASPEPVIPEVPEVPGETPDTETSPSPQVPETPESSPSPALPSATPAPTTPETPAPASPSPAPSPAPSPGPTSSPASPSPAGPSPASPSPATPASPAAEGNKGSIQGRILDEDTGHVVGQSEVLIPELDVETFSDYKGHYAIQGIPVRDRAYEIMIVRPGYENLHDKVVVKDGKPIHKTYKIKRKGYGPSKD